MDLPKQEEQILEFWKKIRAFEKSVENRAALPRAKSRGNFVFYEGPPTANGKPGIHHVLSRAYKDAICRYKTMRGYRVERKAGWDTHGLPVEIEVEKELGLKNKKDIEAYGIGAFNEKCRASVWKYKEDWDKLTERIGFWIDLDHPYITYDPIYMETLWWIIKQAHKKGLLYEGRKVVPYCARCGTSLSSHEVAQGYADVTEDSVFVKLRITESMRLELIQDTRYKIQDTFFLAWTTTPWTLPGNVALAVGEKIDYVAVRQGDETFILAKERSNILNGEYEVIKELKGKELEGIEYEPLYDSLKDAKEKKHYVALADFVTTEEGTGIVHTAVMYGEDDYNLGEKLGLPKVHTVDENGKFNSLVPKWQGKFVKDAEPEIIADLLARNLLYKKEAHTHSYPFCWRCKRPLLYYARPSWFIRMASLREKLLKNNSTINWIPEHIKEGRFGEWLRDVKDWNFSRSRYWGTPLPIWKCEKCGRFEVLGSRANIAGQIFSTNTFYVVRHGESEKNVKDIIASSFPEKTVFNLTKKGVAQVEKAAKKLKKMGGVDYIFSSDFIRTEETAEIIAKEFGIAPEYDERLREYKLGVYDGRFEKEFSKDFPDLRARFKRGPEGGETLAEIQQRMRDFIFEINKRYAGKKILIVSHGEPLWIFESSMLGLTIEETVRREAKDYPGMGEARKVDVKSFPYNQNGELDFHRPYVDEVFFQCASCKDVSSDAMKRVPELADVWFDSGSMPFASAPAGFPADYICEAVDQTRGWFYTLLAVATFLGLKAPYKNVISLGHVLDTHGKKMSKSVGNMIDPWIIIEKYGSDALRWYFYTLNQPGDYKKFDENDVRKTYGKFISTLVNTVLFYKTYSSHKTYKFYNPRHVLDKWAVSRLNGLIIEVVKKFDLYDVTGAARDIENFVINDLSNWYIRRSRKRFQNPETKGEKKAAEQVLGFILSQLSKLCASFIPFLAEQMHQVFGSGSVHWEDFPKADKKYIKKKIEGEMAKARKVVEMGHELRARAGIKVRQPLSQLTASVKFSKEVSAITADELNVKVVEYKTKDGFQTENELWKVNSEGDTLVALSIEMTKELREEGFVKELMRYTQELRKAGGLTPKDRIEVYYSTNKELGAIIQRWAGPIKRQNNANVIQEVEGRREDAEVNDEFEWEGNKVWVGIKKI